MMSSSKPSTPLTQRHQFGAIEQQQQQQLHTIAPNAVVQPPTISPALPTRIPQPSPPQPLRRSLSLRLRPIDQLDSDGGFGSKFSSCTTTAQTSPTPLQRATSTPSSYHKKLPNSKSMSFIGNDTMAHNGAANGQQQHSKKESPPATNGHHNPKFSPTSNLAAASSSFPHHRKHSGNHEHGGLSLNLTHCQTSNSACASHQRIQQQRSGATVQSPLTPRTPNGAAGQLPRISPKTPPVTPDDPLDGYVDDDLDSLYSYTSVASGRSTMSCDHPYVARNGTTFSGRKMKYVVHCSSHAGQTGEDYLTPTQRAQKHIRRLKMLLSQAHTDLEQRDSEILRLTKEVVELRLFKASLSSPEERSQSSDAVTVRENDPKTSTDVSPIVDQTDDGIVTKSAVSPRHVHYQQHVQQLQYLDKLTNSEMQSSFADSGHFEDITTSSINSKDSFVHTEDVACGADASAAIAAATDRSELVRFYEHKIEELIRNHSEEAQEVKVTHNDRVEALLHKLAECNSRYADMVPDYEQAKERIRELERQLEELQLKLQEQEDKQNKMYLHMFSKGQEAQRIQHADKIMEIAQSPSCSRVSVPELMQQLQVTQNELENIKDANYVQVKGNAQILLSAKEAVSLWLLGARKTMYKRLIDAQQTKNKVDPEVTLQFLKSAIYYFLTDKENTQGHLNAIESILGFSAVEKLTIDRARAAK